MGAAERHLPARPAHQPHRPARRRRVLSITGITRDDSAISFLSRKDGLTPDDTNGIPDLYRYSVATGRVDLISRADGAAARHRHHRRSAADARRTHRALPVGHGGVPARPRHGTTTRLGDGRLGGPRGATFADAEASADGSVYVSGRDIVTPTGRRSVIPLMRLATSRSTSRARSRSFARSRTRRRRRRRRSSAPCTASTPGPRPPSPFRKSAICSRILRSMRPARPSGTSRAAAPVVSSAASISPPARVARSGSQGFSTRNRPAPGASRSGASARRAPCSWRQRRTAPRSLAAPIPSPPRHGCRSTSAARPTSLATPGRRSSASPCGRRPACPPSLRSRSRRTRRAARRSVSARSRRAARRPLPPARPRGDS